MTNAALLRSRPAVDRLQFRPAIHHHAIQAGRLRTNAQTATESGPGRPARSSAVTAPSPAPIAQAARRRPSRHNCRHARASGRPHGARDAAELGSIGVQAAGSNQKSTAAVATTPAGSHKSADAQKPRRLPGSRSVSIPHLTRIPSRAQAGGYPCTPVFRSAWRGRRPHTVCGRPVNGREPPF